MSDTNNPKAAAIRICAISDIQCSNGCGMGPCKNKTVHASDCAVHNAPAYPVGACDCGAPAHTEAAPVALPVGSWPWLRGAIKGIPTREEALGGQCTRYVQLDEVLGWIDEGEHRAALAQDAAVGELVAKWLNKKADNYATEHGYDDMGSLSFGWGAHADAKRDYHSSLIELAEEALAAFSAPLPRTGVDECVLEIIEEVLDAKDVMRGYGCKHAPFGEMFAEFANLVASHPRASDAQQESGDWKPELLTGPSQNVCWTQDMVLPDERIDAVVISAADYERDAFEKYLRSIWTQGYGCSKDVDGRYYDGNAQSLWQCWQARGAEPILDAIEELKERASVSQDAAGEFVGYYWIGDDNRQKFCGSYDTLDAEIAKKARKVYANTAPAIPVADAPTDINVLLEMTAVALEREGMKESARCVRGMKPGHPSTKVVSTAQRTDAEGLTDDPREAFIRDVAEQTSEMPDYWSSCAQCERNIERAQDILETAQDDGSTK